MMTNCSLDFFYHLLILFIYQFQLSEKSTKLIISNQKSAIAIHFILSYFIIFQLN